MIAAWFARFRDNTWLVVALLSVEIARARTIAISIGRAERIVVVCLIGTQHATHGWVGGYAGGGYARSKCDRRHIPAPGTRPPRSEALSLEVPSQGR